MMEVNISELKARLSAYLDAVRRGETVTILDRKTPIARIVPLEKEVDDGLVIRPASAPVSDLKKVRGVEPLEPVDVQALLAELRGEN
jgi:prevent-host-death family protein